ncbi:hypothetical protein IG193_00680 [Infirmifilum lucidum]|uniref:DUF8196 domain-containing protein n=1 Tax=Infirmifilum lucidum TaxID=2776706 RepID=A0A7L9FJE4_9CREN|nr:hypothetical protein [Infirmifilum lucidum]QOJ79016.1 hypothetical protein IG193_00680 [Infirmifilum lucidum]
MAISAELYEFIVKVVEDKVRDIKVTREEFDKLAARVGELAEAQKRTEERLEVLTARLDSLAKRVEELAEAQRRTEERLEALARRVEELAEAQRRTEERLEKLVEAVDALRVQVGRLSEAVGFGLEDIARVVLPGWLYRHIGVEVELERGFVEVDGRLVEVDLYGEGTRGGERVLVVGECKSRIDGRDVEKFYREVYKPLSEQRAGVVGVLFGYVIYPDASRRARELGLHVVASYER